jgi:hypothetical protein
MDEETEEGLADLAESRHDPLHQRLKTPGDPKTPRPTQPGSPVARTAPLRCEFAPYVPEQVALGDVRRFGVPVNVPVYVERWHFLATVQAFSRGGYEVTARRVDAQQIAERRCLAPRTVVRQRSEAAPEARDENIRRARFRAKRRVRHNCKQIGADRLLTLTTREQSSTPESMLQRWQHWLRLVERALGRPFHYVAVLEPHPSNPQHLHIHVAVAVYLNVNVLRHCWWQVCGGRGMGNVHVKRLGGAEIERRVSRVASYISKYLMKDTLCRFNKKAYWASRVRLPEVRRYWLKAQDLSAAIRELIEEFGTRLRSGFISPDQTVFWAQMCPGDTAEPPF